MADPAIHFLVENSPAPTLDESIVTALRDTFQDSSFFRELFTLASDSFFWMPFLAFLGLMVAQTQKGKQWLSVFFGLGAYVIAFQFSAWLAGHLERPAPFFVMSGHEDPSIFEKRGELPFSLPDWATASMVAVVVYTIIVLRKQTGWTFRLILLGVPFLLGIARMETGLCFPSDFAAGYLVGVCAGFLLSRFQENLDLLMGTDSGGDTLGN